MPIRPLLTLTMGALMTLSALAQEAPVTAPPEPAEAEISNFTLDNGLEVVVIPDRRAPIVTHMVWYKIGSADEPAGKSGIAHFLEHLMFKGTEKHPAGEMDRTIAEVGGYTNAFTTKDVTVYLQTVPPDMLASMMDFEADRMRGLVLPEAVIDAERDVILEERNQRIEGSPQALLAEESAATLYQNHPYRVPVIGWLHEMEQLSREDALDFYHRYYAPNNAVLVVAGDVDAEEVRSMAEATYGKVERGPDLPPRIRPSEPHQDTARTVTLSDPRVGVPSFTRGWLTPTYRTAENGEAEALDLLSEILGGGSRSRFYQEIVVKQGLASAAGAGYDGGSYDPSNFTVYGAPQGEHTLDEVEAAVTAEVKRLIDDGVTPEELDAAKMRYVRGLIFARDEQSNMANIYGSRLANDGTVEDVEQWPDRIRAVTPEQIQAVAKKYLDPNVSVTGYLLPSENGAQ